MTKLPQYFLMLAVLAALMGMSWGIHMAISQDHSLAPAHAHLNLVGWVTFSIFAFYYHLMPSAAASGLAKLHFGLAVAGLVLMIPGIYLALTQGSEPMAAIGSILTLLSMLTFGVVVLRHGLQR
ncbi:hypothetical protein [Seohaeicola zhoushanensis]|uniref:Uncharacterized protein n=1 Tax=Seohaeicola zhoushanensis TaxID=1569283 RepID=A0A8J3GZX3_9RHOB|nr:hypothetical protein [Seohaeicola zhoushanensis]GHF57409.1 hypothetical protein GCM10017056_31080 [Seohaeicola zhoushanensis]